MTEQMAVVAARSIAAEVKGGDGESPRPLAVECILDMGARAARIKADPVRPPRNHAAISDGRRWLWAKRFFERYYLWRMKRGRTVSTGWGW